MTSALDLLLHDITGKINDYDNDTITDYQSVESTLSTSSSVIDNGLITHSHVFQNPLDTEDYEPVFVHGLNTKYMDHLLRLQCEKPVIFTSERHDKQIICHPGQEVSVQNTGPYPIANSARITVVPPLTIVRSKISDQSKTLLQTVEWETFNQNLWDLMLFLQGVTSVTLRICQDMDNFNESYWDILGDKYDEQRQQPHYLIQEIHLALEKHFPLSQSREKIKILVKFIRDYWIVKGGFDDTTSYTLPLMLPNDIMSRLHRNVAGLYFVSQNAEQTTALKNAFLQEYDYHQASNELLPTGKKTIDELLDSTYLFGDMLFLFIRRFKVFKTIVVADVISASSEQIYPGSCMTVRVAYT